MTDYPHVFSPLKIGSTVVKNRIEAAPMLSCLDSEGLVSKDLIAYFQAFARGGAAIVTIGDSTIDYLNGRFHNGELNLGDDRIIGGLSVFAEAIQRYGAKASIEVNHAGMIAATQPGVRPIGPTTTTFTFRDHPYPVLGLTKDMIDELIDRYASACERALRAGLDMVMLHGGHGWMPALFASTLTNQRTDEYGGSLENRARFAIELLTEVRRRVGDRLTLEYRISSEELVPGGMKIDETIEFIKLIQDKIDLIHVSIGVVDPEPKYGMWSQPVYYPHNYIVPFAEMIRREVAIPVTTVGSIMTVADAEQIIADGKADIVAMARSLIADPDLVNKSFHGKVDEIRPCTRCCKCLDRPAFFFPVRCAVNPVAGREVEYRTIPRAEVKKTVVVVGGGPAGMQAALTASERGHKVVLFEQEQSLGGAMRPASGLPFKYDLRKYMDWVAKKTLGSGVDVRLGVEATPDLVRAEQPDALIVAVGAEPNIPQIVIDDNAPVLLAADVDAGAETGDTVVVVGGGLVGCEAALYLAMAGKRVTIVDILEADGIAKEGGLTTRAMLLALLEDNRVAILTGTKVEEVHESGVIVVGKEGDPRRLPADTVIIATGYRAKQEQAESFRGSAYDVFYVGDCRAPENILTAVHSGFNVAVEL